MWRREFHFINPWNLHSCFFSMYNLPSFRTSKPLRALTTFLWGILIRYYRFNLPLRRLSLTRFILRGFHSFSWYYFLGELVASSVYVIWTSSPCKPLNFSHVTLWNILNEALITNNLIIPWYARALILPIWILASIILMESYRK